MNSTALFDIAVMKWYQRKYYVLYNIRNPIMNSILLIYLIIFTMEYFIRMNRATSHDNLIKMRRKN